MPRGDLARVRQTRVAVCRVSVRLDVASPPLDPACKLPARGAAAYGVKVMVFGAPALHRENLGRVVADGKHAVSTTSGGIASGADERVQAGTGLEHMDGCGLPKSPDHDAAPAVGRDQSVWKLGYGGAAEERFRVGGDGGVTAREWPD